MHGKYPTRAICHGCVDKTRIDIHGAFVDVDENGRGALVENAICRRDKAEGRCYNFIAGPDFGRVDTQVQSCCAARHGDGVTDTDVVSEGTFELLQKRSHTQAIALKSRYDQSISLDWMSGRDMDTCRGNNWSFILSCRNADYRRGCFDVTRDNRARADYGPVADRSPRNNLCTSSDKGTFSNLNLAGNIDPWRKVSMCSDTTVMIDRARGIENAVGTDPRIRIDDDVRKHDNALAKRYSSPYGSAWMSDGCDRCSSRLQLVEQPLTFSIITNADKERIGRML